MLSINVLPVELLTRVLDSLEDTDVLNFRSLDRQINQKTFFTFKNRFFHRRRYQFSRRGLESLTAISQDERFARLVKHLHISLHRWNHDNLHAKLFTITRDPEGKGANNEPNRRSALHYPMRYENIRRTREGFAITDSGEPSNEEVRRQQVVEIAKRVDNFDQQLAELIQLLESGDGEALITTAISRLTNLNSIGIDEKGARHCWDVHGALEGARCGDIAGIRGGWEILGKELGGIHRLQRLERFFVFWQLLRSLSTSAPLQLLTTLEIQVSTFEFDHEPVTMPRYLEEQLTSCKLTFIDNHSDLRTLDSRTDEIRYGPAEENEYCRPERAKNWLVQWVQRCYRLERLILVFGDYHLARRVSIFANNFKLPSLRHFGLSGGLDFRENPMYDALAIFLKEHRANLSSLYLADVKLGPLSWREDNNTCSDLLKLLASLERLEEVRFEGWKEKVNISSYDGAPVLFTPSETSERAGAWMLRGTTDDIQRKLLEASSTYKLKG